MENKIVYHNVFKFGYVISSDKESKKVLFNEVGEKLIVNSYLRDVDLKTYNYIINEEYKDSFDSVTFNRGLNYAKEDRVLDYSLTARSQSIKGTVLGNEKYETVCEANDDKFTFICSCPVGFNCKHAAALMIHLNNEFNELDKLKNNYLSSLNIAKKEEINEDDYSDISDLINASKLINASSKIDALCRYTSLLDNCDTNKLTSFLSYLIKSGDYVYKFKYLYFSAKAKNNYLSLNKKADEYIFFKNECNKHSQSVKYYLNQKGIINYKFLIDGLKFYLINGYFKYAIKCILLCYSADLNIDEYLNECSDYINYIKQNNSADSIYDSIKSFFSKYKVTNSLKFIKAFLNDEYLNKLICDDSVSINLSISDLDEFSDEYIFDAIKNVGYTDKLYKYVMGDSRFKKIDSLKYLKLLETMFFNYDDSKKRTTILFLIESYPNSKYLTEYFNDYTYPWFLFDTEALEFDYDLFSIYFKFSYNVYKTYKGIEIDYRLSLDNGTVIFEVATDEKNSAIKSSTNNNNLFYNKYADCFFEWSVKLFKDEIQEKYKALFESIERKRELENKKLLLNSIENFDKVFNDNNAIIDEVKPHLEVSIGTNVGNAIKLDLKIGVKKMYIGKGSYDILYNFYYNNTYKYGKELTFTHIIDNLKSPYDKLISYYTSIPLRAWEGNYSKQLYLSSGMLFETLKILVNESINFNDNSYLVLADDFDYSYSIDNNYVLNINTKYNILSFGLLFVALDDVTHTLRFKNVSAKDKALYQFQKENSGKSLKPIKDEFKNNVISRYSCIEIDDSIKNEFKISELKIDAYFDFVNKYITLTSKLYKDDKEANIDDLTPNDKSKLVGYQSYISHLGFVDGICKDLDCIYNFFQMDFADLKRFANVYLSETIQSKKIISLNEPTINMSYQSGMMDVFIEDSDFSDRELEEIIKALRHKKKYLILKDDRIIDLNSDNAFMLENLVDDMHLDIKALTKPQPMPLYQVLNAYAIKSNIKTDEFLSNMVSNISNFKSASIKLPEINANLREYQREGFNWLSILSSYHLGGILADDMGLGKTLQIITLIASSDCKMPSLIVCPKSLIFNWMNEFHKFAQDVKVVGIHGTQQAREQIIKGINLNDNVVYITSYDSIRSDIELYNNIKFNFIILDEAQYIKNSQALKSISVKMLNGMNRFALTGTPIENNILDLWSIFDFIMPGYFEEVSTFKSKYNSCESYSNRILKKISPFILRRTKENVLKDLPPKYERIISAEMTVEQRKLYDAHRKIAKDALIAGGKAFDMLPILTRLRQICVDPAMFVDSYEGKSGKLLLFYETVDEYITLGHRMLVFSQFVKCLEDIEIELKKKGIKYLKITGDTSALNRVNYVNLFNNDDSISLFLISLHAGGTGLNLIGADTVIHLDPWWNVAAENQATDRAHRIGQTRNVEVIKFICENSIEQRVIELQNMKKDIIDKFISNDDSSVSSITLDDLSFILD